MNQPVSLEDVRYEVMYRDRFYRPDDPRLDRSHIHSSYEIYLNLSGNVSFLVNNHLYGIRRGDVIVSRPGDIHLCVFNEPCVHRHYCLWLSCGEGSPVGKLLETAFSEHFYAMQGELEQLTELFERLLRHRAPDLNATAALLQLLLLLQERGESGERPAPSNLRPEMQEIVDDINEHFTEITHINQVLGRYYISRATLNRWFRQDIRLTPKEFLEAKKLSYAKTLLQGGKSVTEVCMQVGFTSPSHFIAVFKKRFGETPLQYKNRLLHPGAAASGGRP